MTASNDDILWRLTAGESLDAERLGADVTADAVVVGGGFTGLSAALHLAEANAKVRVLEAETVGFGGSGRNVGLVNAGLWTPPDGVEDALGVIAGTRLNEILAGGPDCVFSLIEKHGIECDAVRNGTLHCAHSPAGLADLEDRYHQQRRRNAPVELLNDTLVRKRIGSGYYHGALLDRRAGTVQPLAYAKGLARAALAAGAVLHEGTPAVAVEHDSDLWRVKTPDGSVRAPSLIVATNAYGHSAGALRRPAFVPVHYFQLATAPLDEDVREALLPGGEGCWDTAQVMSSFRLDASGRLLFGSVGALDRFGANVHRAWALRRMSALFPMVREGEIEHVWHGRIAMTADHMPKIAELGPRGIAIYGYSGRGIAPGTLFGRAAAQWALDGDASALPVVPTPRQVQRQAALRSTWYELGATLVHFIDARGGRQ